MLASQRASSCLLRPLIPNSVPAQCQPPKPCPPPRAPGAPAATAHAVCQWSSSTAPSVRRAAPRGLPRGPWPMQRPRHPVLACLQKLHVHRPSSTARTPSSRATGASTASPRRRARGLRARRWRAKAAQSPAALRPGRCWSSAASPRARGRPRPVVPLKSCEVQGLLADAGTFAARWSLAAWGSGWCPPTCGPAAAPPARLRRARPPARAVPGRRSPRACCVTGARLVRWPRGSRPPPPPALAAPSGPRRQ
mmetsp:Transcript_114345/g.334298  ORF Transcript_114345/g.334298 Transcript_114345/m.334298 type:complete len:251 (-) Transcript_114345:936-1688(-)